MLWLLLALMPLPISAQASPPPAGPAALAPVELRASSELAAGFTASNAADGDAQTAWCAAETPPAEGRFRWNGETFDDWWEAALAPGARLGAIHLRSGLPAGGRVQGHKARDFAWIYQRRGETAWRALPGTSLYANRYQLILRFPATTDVARVRMLMRTRDPEERRLTGSNAPCLREVRFYADPAARIPVRPWFFTVATWEEGNRFDPLLHWGDRLELQPPLQQAIHEITGGEPYADIEDQVWIEEFNPRPGQAGPFADWLLREPAPAAFLLSGNYRDFEQVDAGVYAGFHRFMNQPAVPAPMLGACGGHQLMAMAVANPAEAAFRDEFTADRVDQTVVTCSTDPAYGCAGASALDCCYEGGAVNPYKWLSPNLPGVAMANPYASPRADMLFNLLPPEEGIAAYLYHSDYVNPERIRGRFDIIATYPRAVAGLSRANPSLVQAMKLRGQPVYGTQFHWDQTSLASCARNESMRAMERVLKNFVLLSLSRTGDPSAFSVTPSASPEAVPRLFDLDRASEWCAPGDARGEAALDFDFKRPVPLKYLLTVEGDTAGEAAARTTSYQWSADGRTWNELGGRRASLHGLQASRLYACPGGVDALPGREDGQSFLTTFEKDTVARFFRIKVRAGGRAPLCFREIHLLKLDAQGSL